MQRLFNIDKWQNLKEGDALAFSNPRPRNVRVEVNAPTKSSLYYVDPEGEVIFLALVEGRDTIEFGSTGAFQLTVEGAPVMVYTADGADISMKPVSHGSFTKIVERRRRNPELEQIAALMQRNMERRLEQQSAELEQLFTRRAAAFADAQRASQPSNVEPQPAPSGSGEGAPPAPTSSNGENGNGPSSTAGPGAS